MQVDLTRLILSIIAIVGLLAGSLWILSPFLGSIIWATMIAVATWPLMLRLETLLWRRRGLAVAVMTLSMLVVFIIPFVLAIVTLVDHADVVLRWSRELADASLPPLPDWVVQLPVVGGTIASAWETLRSAEMQSLVARAIPYAGRVMQWLASHAGGAGLFLVQILLTVVITAVMYAGGEHAVQGVMALARRIGGQSGENAVRLAGMAIRGVALGVVVTALIQSVVAGVGLAIAGIPFATLLTAAAFILCIAQIGAGPVLIPAVIWLYWSGAPGWGTFLLVWSAVVMGMDNVIRPLLIRRGVDLPLLLIFAGVIGGLLTMGLIGLFVGPVLLAVTFKLFAAWAGLADPIPAGAQQAPAESAESVAPVKPEKG